MTDLIAPLIVIVAISSTSFLWPSRDPPQFPVIHHQIDDDDLFALNHIITTTSHSVLTFTL
jgi:hypothetical protein